MLEGLKPVKKVRNCKVRTILNSLDAKDEKILREALADENVWTNHTLERALSERGILLDHRQIDKHRTLSCSCRELEHAG